MRKSLLIATSALAMNVVILDSAHAQAQPAAAAEKTAVQEVIVTGSRISLSGYRQPTPVTVLTAEQIQRNASVDIGAMVRDLPSVGISASPNSSVGNNGTSGASAGQSNVNLRGLGTNRTLVLFDGVRAVASSTSGGVDLNLFPSTLVGRIDVVTGGASSSWGSDAVSGVVNIILDKGFTGWKANVEGNINEWGNRKSGKADITFGSDVLGGRGHVLLSASYLDSPEALTHKDFRWNKFPGLVQNPLYTATNNQPRMIHAENVRYAPATKGGLITGGPLRGTAFGPNGTPYQFNFGNVSGLMCTDCSGERGPDTGQGQNVSVPFNAETAFGYFSYDVTENLKASFQAAYGHSFSINSTTSYARNGNITVTIDNPYLDATTVSRMQTAGVTSFPFGTTNVNNCDSSASFITEYCLGNLHNETDSDMGRYVGRLDGRFNALNTDWTWDANVQYSQVHRHTHMVVDPDIAKYNLAIDAVRVTSGNVGASGLAIGSIVCRSTLTSPTNGCVPLNLFGEGVASKGAIDYVNSSPATTDLTLRQLSGGFHVQGEPFNLFAGPVAVAFGGDLRRESVLQTADPLSYARGYAAGNWQYQKSKEFVYEGFAEANIKLIEDGLVRDANLSLAGRLTDYESSGRVGTWKVGLTSQIVDSFRVRTSVSSDIRAPTLNDLYNPGSTSIQTVNDPFRAGSPATNIFTLSQGNPDLKPERSRTYAAGFVLTPSFVPNLQLSADYYQINITDAISSAVFTATLQQCFAGVQVYCPLIRRDANGVITQIVQSPINAASEVQDGVDLQADYSTDWRDGKLKFSLIGSHINQSVLTQLGSVVDRSGSLGCDAPINCAGSVKWKGSASATYTTDRFSTTLQVRYVGPGVLSKYFTAKDVDDNSIPDIAYADFRASYYLNEARNFQAFIAVDNVLDRDPPQVPKSYLFIAPTFFVPTRDDIYDTFGRVFRFGLRMKF